MEFMGTGSILQIIEQNKDRFSTQQIKIAGYLLANHDKVAFLTATQIAREIGVSQPTMIRFAQMLGFPKYNLFVEAFQDILKAELTSADRFNLSLESRRFSAQMPSDIIVREIKTLTAFAQSFPKETFEKAVELICGSSRICIAGTRGSASLAQYFAYFLGKVKRGVFAVAGGSSSVYDQLLRLAENDLLIALAFPRYPREIIELARFARKRRIRIIGISDRLDSPLSQFSTLSVVTPVTFSTIFDSYCSVLCLFNMLVTETGRANAAESAALFREFEELAREIKIFL
jgi:DNA-binding MurR/RpiR family transcriptional regulator